MAKFQTVTVIFDFRPDAWNNSKDSCLFFLNRHTRNIHRRQSWQQVTAISINFRVFLFLNLSLYFFFKKKCFTQRCPLLMFFFSDIQLGMSHEDGSDILKNWWMNLRMLMMSIEILSELHFHPTVVRKIVQIFEKRNWVEEISVNRECWVHFYTRANELINPNTSSFFNDKLTSFVRLILCVVCFNRSAGV